MKLKTAGLIIGMAAVFTVLHFFIRDTHNVGLLQQEFVILSYRVSVARLMVILMILSMVVPGLYFTFSGFAPATSSGNSDGRHAPDSKTIAGAELVMHGHFEDALSHFADVQSDEECYWRARALVGLRRHEEALQLIDEHQDAQSLYLKAEIQGHLGLSSEDTWRQLIIRSGHGENAYQALLKELARNHRWWDCVVLLEQMAEKNIPFDPETLASYRYQWVVSQDTEPKNRIEEFQRILKMFPDFVPANVALGDVYMETGSIEKAFRVYEQAFERTSHMVFLDRLESYYLGQGRPEDVLGIYRQLLIQRNSVGIRIQLMRLYMRLSMYEECREILDSLSHMECDELMWARSVVDLKSGDSEKAAFNLSAMVEDKLSVCQPYACKHCSTAYDSWMAQCKQCGQWNGISSAIQVEDQPAVASAPIY